MLFRMEKSLGKVFALTRKSDQSPDDRPDAVVMLHDSIVVDLDIFDIHAKRSAVVDHHGQIVGGVFPDILINFYIGYTVGRGFESPPISVKPLCAARNCDEY